MVNGPRTLYMGRYLLLTPLGAGADGIAYRAEHNEDGQPLQHVELRVLSGALEISERWSWIERRMQIAAHLEHPGALRLKEACLDHSPPFVSIEWLERGHLGQWVETQWPAVEETIRLGERLASALAAAHRLGLSHPGLCPSAVLGALHLPVVDFLGLEVNTVANPGHFAAINAACLPPEAGHAATPSGNVYALGAILFWLLTRRRVDEGNAAFRSGELTRAEIPKSLQQCVLTLLDPDPEMRPAAHDVVARLHSLHAPVQATGAFEVANLGQTGDLTEQTDPGQTGADDPRAALGQTGDGTETEPGQTRQLPPQLGRYRLLEKLGQGGMGAVYRAVDVTNGVVVALKMLRPDWASHPQHLRRFQKEARMLAEVNNPFVTNLLDVNVDDGIHYLAMEFVAGTSLEALLRQRGKLDEVTSLTVMADVARGLVQAHAAGIIHRDIKPDNILLMPREPVEDHPSGPSPEFVVKLADFGLARHVVESESLNVTQAGSILGTPLYMAPEQCTGAPVDARSDVYSLGATFFHLLAGRPPFEGPTPLTVITKHCNEAVPSLQKFNPAVSDGMCRVITKALAKHPDARYGSAAEILDELERLLRGEPSTVAVHPRIPECDTGKIQQYDFSWELESSPAQLWPHVSNTERLNRAIGLSAPQYETKAEPAGTAEKSDGKRVRRLAKVVKKGSVSSAWEEHPYEWVEGRRLGILREYTEGPFRWMVSIVELEPRAQGGTLLHHRLRMEPRNLLIRTFAPLEIGIRTKKSLEQVYRRIDRAIQGSGTSGRLSVDPFEEPNPLSKQQRQRLERLLSQLAEEGVDPTVLERLGDFVATGPAQEVARIRPLALARRLGVDGDAMIAACLRGARAGLLSMMWDILCPICRIPSEVKETLKALKEHGNCAVCQLDFDLDFANSVEMIFRVHPDIREAELATYCIGGPVHSPHVVAQTRVAAGERIELDLNLTDGAYRLRGPQLPYAIDFRVEPGSRLGRWDLSLTRPPGSELVRELRPGAQILALSNDSAQELVVRVERLAPRTDAVTAARASALALFRELFPGEALSPGQLISVTTLTFLFADLVGAEKLYRDLGDAQAFNRVSEYFRVIQAEFARQGGALVKTVGEGMLAVFTDPVAAVRACLEMRRLLAEQPTTRDLTIRVGVHRGPALAATLNGQLDYFGATLHQTMSLPEMAVGGEMLLTQPVAAEPAVATLLAERDIPGDVIGGDAGLILHRFVLPGGPA